MTRIRLAVVLVVAMTTATTDKANAAAVGTENFDAGIPDWYGSVFNGSVTHSATGGNPNGYLATISVPDFPNIIGATNSSSDYSGDFTAAGISNVMVDLNFYAGDFTDALIRFRYKNGGFNGWTYSLTSTFANSWESFSVTFDPSWTDAQATANGWTRESRSTSFANLWTDVLYSEVRLLGSSGNLAAGIDNYALKTVPEPTAALFLCVLGLGVGMGRRRRLVNRSVCIASFESGVVI